jgi:hypothetical protein
LAGSSDHLREDFEFNERDSWKTDIIVHEIGVCSHSGFPKAIPFISVYNEKRLPGWLFLSILFNLSFFHPKGELQKMTTQISDV